MPTKRRHQRGKPKRLASARPPNLDRLIARQRIMLRDPPLPTPKSPIISATQRRCEDTSTNGTTDIGGDGISPPSFLSEPDITIGMRAIGIQPGVMILLITTTITTVQSIPTVIFSRTR